MTRFTSRPLKLLGWEWLFQRGDYVYQVWVSPFWWKWFWSREAYDIPTAIGFGPLQVRVIDLKAQRREMSR